MRMVWGLVVMLGCKDDPKPKVEPVAKNLVPLAGDGFDQMGERCLLPTITQLRKQPNWMIRIARKLSGYHDSVTDSVVEWTAGGATWHHPWTPEAKSTLSAELVTRVEDAVAKSCEQDRTFETAYPDHDEFFGFGWGVELATGYDFNNTATSVPGSSEIARALSPIFAAAQQWHVTQRIALARTLRLDVKGHELVSAHDAPKDRWRARTIVVDLTRPSPDVPDADAVRFLDWAQTLRADRPAHLTRGPKLLEGTMALDGKVRKVVIDLGVFDDDQRRYMRDLPVFREIVKIQSANYFKFSFD